MNENAGHISDESLYGKNITEYLSHKNRLQFEIAMNSKKPQPFIAAAKLIPDYPYLCIVPGRVGYCSYAMVTFNKSIREAECYTPDYSGTTNADIMQIINSLLSEQGNKSVSGVDDSIFDAKAAVTRLAKHLNTEGALPNGLKIKLNEKAISNNLCFCNCGLSSFLSLFTSIAFLADEIYHNEKAEIGFSNIGNSFDIRLTIDTGTDCFSDETDMLENIFPSYKLRSDMCQYIAQSCGCQLCISADKGCVAFTASFNFPSEYIDFKSNDPFKHLDHMLDNILQNMIAIYKEEAPE